jgi:hypothetical protein
MAGAVVDTVTDAADLPAVADMQVAFAVVMPAEHAVSQVAGLAVEHQ